jgi:hypothetical protein
MVWRMAAQSDVQTRLDARFLDRPHKAGVAMIFMADDKIANALIDDG